MTEEEEGMESVTYREEVLRLVAEGKIRHTAEYVEKSPDKKVERIFRDYIAKNLEETNDHITNTLIKQFSGLMTTLGLVEDGVSLEKDLESNELFKRDVKNILSYVTPYIPLVGLVCGGICLGRHVMKKEPKGEKRKKKKKKGKEKWKSNF